MNRDEIIRMAREVADIETDNRGREEFIFDFYGVERFANLVAAAEREKVAAWMMKCGYATGHGDSIEDLLGELAWQIEEKIATLTAMCETLNKLQETAVDMIKPAIEAAVLKEREACAKVLDEMAAKDKLSNYYKVAALAIRERGAP